MRTGRSEAQSDSGGQPSRDPERASESDRLGVVRFAVWLGLLAWVAEYSVLTFRRFALHKHLIWYIESMWLAAVVYTLLFALVGLVLARLVRARPERWRRIAFSVLTGLAVLCILLVFDIHHLAALVLSAGIGYQLGRAVAGHQAGARRIVRMSLPPLAAMSAAVVILLIVLEPIRDWRAYSRVAEAEPGAPNVVLLILDTVRARDLGLYGYALDTTPALEEMAKHSVTFDRGYSTAPWTLPAHFSMLTGLYVHEMPVGLKDMVEPAVDAQWPYLAEVLADQGYATAGFVANMAYLTDEYGLDRGFIHWDDHTISLGQAGISTAIGRAILNNGRLRRLLDWHEVPIRKHASRVNAAMLDWIDHHSDRPFFVLANYFDAHVPYLAPSPFEERFVTLESTVPLFYRGTYVAWLDKRNHTRAEFEAQRQAYDAAVAYLDNQLGRLFHELRSRGLMDNTLIVIAADHGEAFGGHGSLGHAGSEVYTELVRVPLMFRFPGRVPEGVRVTRPVSLVDLPATILDLVGVEGSGIPGRSLASAWRSGGSRARLSPVISSANPDRDKTGLLLDNWHYIRSTRGEYELYDLADEPFEQHDRGGDADALPRLRLMSAALDSLLAIPPERRVRTVDCHAAGLGSGSTGSASTAPAKPGEAVACPP